MRPTFARMNASSQLVRLLSVILIHFPLSVRRAQPWTGVGISRETLVQSGLGIGVRHSTLTVATRRVFLFSNGNTTYARWTPVDKVGLAA